MTTPESKNTEIDTSYDRYVDSQPVLNMLEKLSLAGYTNFKNEAPWEVCFCALILWLNPKCKFLDIIESLPYQLNQLDELSFLNSLAHLGYVGQKSDTHIDDIDTRLLPALFIPKNSNPLIILGRTDKEELYFYDPISKLISHNPSTIEKNGKIILFKKYDADASPTSKFIRNGTGHSWLRALIGRFSQTITQIMVSGLFLNLIALITPIYIMVVYDRVIATGSLDSLPMLTFGVIMAIGFEWRLRIIRSRGLSWFAGRLDNIVSNKIFAHLIGLSPELIEKASVSAQIARIKTFESIREVFSGSAVLSVLELPFVFLSIITIAVIAGPLAFVPMAIIATYAVLFYLIRNKIKSAIRLAAKSSSARQQFTIETFEKSNSIYASGLSKKWHDKFRNLSGREMHSHFYLGWLGMIAETMAHTLTILSSILIIGLGVQMVWAGALSPGALIASMILVWRILTPFYSLCTMIPRLEQLRNAFNQVNDLIELETEADIIRTHSELKTVMGAVAFDTVDFQYKGSTDKILSNLSFDANAGELVILKGAKGSGKASILKLILSLYQPSSGSITIDGFDIRQLDVVILRKKIAYVPSTPEFFTGSIIDNLRLSNPLATKENIINALKLADVWDVIKKMDRGLNTIIQLRGNQKLSPAIAMRLCLARAYINPANILLIDSLPNELLSSQAGINLKNHLANVKGKHTVIIATQRQDFINLADKVVNLDKRTHREKLNNTNERLTA